MSAAIPFFNRAIELDPNFAAAYISLGNFVFQPARARFGQSEPDRRRMTFGTE